MRRKPRPPAQDHRQPWQIEQGSRCACRGADDMCACQNENPWPRPRRDFDGEIRTLELQQQTDRQTIAALTARAETAERLLGEVVGAKSALFDALWELLSALAEPAQKPERVNAAKDAARRVCLDEHSREALSKVSEEGFSSSQGSVEGPGCVPAANRSHQPSAEGAVSPEGK